MSNAKASKALATANAFAKAKEIENRALVKGINAVSKFAENVSEDITYVLEGLQNAAIKYSDPVAMKKLLYSIGALIILFIVGYKFYQMLQYAHPRFFGLSHTEDMGKIDDEIRESMAKALTSYYIGISLPNYLKQKGPYPDIYSISPEDLQTILRGISTRLNFHKTSRTYKELLKIASLGGLAESPSKPHNHKVVYDFFYKAMGTSKHPLRTFVKANTAVFKADLEKLNSISFFNFIDYYPYERRTPEKDKTLIRYGSLATPGGKALAEIFNSSALTSKVEPLLSVSAESIMASIDSKEKRIKTLVAYLRSVKYNVFSGAGINEGDYMSDIKEQAQHVGVDTHPHPRMILSQAISSMEIQMDLIETMLIDGVTQEELDRIESDIYYSYETFLHIQYDTGNGPLPVLTPKLIKAYLYAYNEVIALLQYKYYKQTIYDSMFLILYWYFGCPQYFAKNMQQLSEFYLSFNELSLFQKYDDHVAEYREWRAVNKETVDTMYMDNLLTPNFNLYIMGNIYKNVILDWIDWATTFNDTKCYWDYFKTLMSNPGTFLGADFDDGSKPKKCVPNEKHVKVSKNQSTGVKFNDAAANANEFFSEGWGGTPHSPPTGESIKNENTAPQSSREGFDGGQAPHSPPSRWFKNNSASVKPPTRGDAGGTPPLGAVGGVPPPPIKEGFFGVLGDIASGLAALPGLASNAIRLCVDLVTRVLPMLMNLMQGLIGMVITLITEVLPKVVSLLGLVMKYVNNPLKFLTMVAGFIMYVIATVLLLILKLSFGYELGHIVIAIAVKVGMFFVGAAIAAYNAAMFAMIVTVGLVFAILDGIYFDGVLTRTLYNWFLACETSPFQWHENSNYQTGNKFERKTGVCARPCPEGFEPGMGGFMCVRNPDYIPKQCPQSAIQRIYKEKSISTPYVLSRNISQIDWGNMSKNKKSQMTVDMREAKQDYHATCAVNMHKYDNSAINVCRNIDTVASTKQDRAALIDICTQTYCRNGNSEPWCYKMRTTSLTKEEGISDQNVFVQMLLYSTIITGFITITYLLHRGKMLQS